MHPFSGDIADGFVWGRGALDMKGMGIMELMAFIAAARQGLELKRDVVFLAVADEEAGGYSGARMLLENHPEELEADLVINEGGYATLDLVAGRPFFMIANAEKYGYWLRLKRRGVGGHGSMPTGQGALDLHGPRPREASREQAAHEHQPHHAGFLRSPGRALGDPRPVRGGRQPPRPWRG